MVHAATLKRWFFLLLAVAVLWSASLVEPRLRARQPVPDDDEYGAAPPEYVLSSALLGGFRGVLVSFLMFRAQDMRYAGKRHELVDLYRIVLNLEPNYPALWSHIAHDLTFNISTEEQNDPQERRFWVFAGIDLLRLEGVVKNPKSAPLYHDVAYFIEQKLSRPMDPAYALFRERMFSHTNGILGGSGEPRLLEWLAENQRRYPTRAEFLDVPEHTRVRDRLAALNTDLFTDAGAMLAAYRAMQRDREAVLARAPTEKERTVLKLLMEDEAFRETVREAAGIHMRARLRAELNMDVAEMHGLSQRFGPIDWRLGPAQQLYWAWLGDRIHEELYPESNTPAFRNTIASALILLAHHGETQEVQGEGYWGNVDERMITPVADYLEHLVDTSDKYRNKVGTRAQYETYLSSTVLNLYLADKKQRAREVQLRLADFTGLVRDRKPLDQYVGERIAHRMKRLNRNEAPQLIGTLLGRSYLSLAQGEIDAYRGFQRAARGIFDHFSKAGLGELRPGEELRDDGSSMQLPPWDNLRAQAARVVLSGSWYNLTNARRAALLRLLQRLEPDTFQAIRAIESQIQERRDTGSDLLVPEEDAE